MDPNPNIRICAAHGASLLHLTTPPQTVAPLRAGHAKKKKKRASAATPAAKAERTWKKKKAQLRESVFHPRAGQVKRRHEKKALSLSFVVQRVHLPSACVRVKKSKKCSAQRTSVRILDPQAGKKLKKNLRIGAGFRAESDMDSG